ncbi:hypothetical protein AB205_0089290 [Aquarana catesbeiana]|uniref:MADF domain-containing protein n=1 Tax=Aquarana catesbeiana TaxID=8400 RepID=A0A2G9QLQ8_AQUCT|nr:hypothetical protein AB205_0089290 [Aquarana catesbeiana]
MFSKSLLHPMISPIRICALSEVKCPGSTTSLSPKKISYLSLWSQTLTCCGANFHHVFLLLLCLAWGAALSVAGETSTSTSALEKLLELVKLVVPTATIPYLKAKIGGLRSTYLRERKKVTDSQRSRAAADDVYVPRLWYHESLRFLSDQTGVRESLSTLPSTLPSTPAEASDVQPGTSSQEEEDLSQDEGLECGSQEEAVECGSQEEARISGSQEEAGLSGSQEKPGTSRSLTESQVPPLRLPNKRPRKGSHLQDSALRLIQEASASLRATPTPEEAFACMATTKLRGMQEGQCQLCEDLLYKVLTKGVRGKITPNTHVIELEHPTPPPPPATTTPPQPQRGRKRGRKTRESRYALAPDEWHKKPRNA